MIKRLLLSLITIIFLSNMITSASVSQSLGIKEIKLDNGLTVWLNEDHSQPKVFGAVVIKAGSRECPNTGIAHYFEHMMFKGTDKIGTTDYASEKIILDRISDKYDELSATSDEANRKKIQSEINELSIEAAKYAIPNEFDRLISKFGGSGLNAWTGYDNTVYHNTFSPQYFSQWAEVCSERIINPVFRLFQSELETVYEEKNMYADQLVQSALEKVLENFFSPHPYAYPIIGSTENLKNPKLSEMKKFFGDYYVAGNMGLILSGDFNTDEIIPVLEKSFGRIKKGIAPVKEIPQPKDFKGEQSVDILVKIPVIKLKVVAWRGVQAGHEDEIPLKVVTGLLSNNGGTGLLNKLTTDGKLLEAMLMTESMNDAGILYCLVLPKLAFQSPEKAKKLVMTEIEKIKKGEFPDSILNSLKLEIKREHESQLEDIASRSQQMISIFTNGKSWSNYLQQIDNIDKITKEDIVRIACKYFTDDRIVFNKKTGSYKKDNLQKPPFAPIVPPNREAKSEYLKQITSQPVNEKTPRFLDFNKDAIIKDLNPLATLYITPNPVNPIFTLTADYLIGKKSSKMVEPLSSYLNYLGTDEMKADLFRGKLQQLGSGMTFSCDENKFSINITGFDENFEQTMVLVSQFLKTVKPDKKQIKNIRDAVRIRDKAEKKNPDNMAQALMDKIMYGEKSPEINRMSAGDVRKLRGPELISGFKDILKTACDIRYCGSSEAGFVEETIKKYLNTDEIVNKTDYPVHLEYAVPDKPKIYFINSSKSNQSVVLGLVPGEVNSDTWSRNAARLYNNYFGSSMSSILFQEIREFRSMAYRVRANYVLPSYSHRDKSGFLKISMSTQCDKTTDAIKILDSLVTDMPVKPERIEISKADLVNYAFNSFPGVREISGKISACRREGLSEDPNKSLLEDATKMDIETVTGFFDKNIKGKPVVYFIVGDKKKVDIEKLAGYGSITFVKVGEVFR